MIGAEIQKIVAEGTRALEGAQTAAAVREAFAAANAADELLERGLKLKQFASDEELEAAREPLRILWMQAWAAKNARKRSK